MSHNHPENAERNAKILALRGQKSFGLIARELGITRQAVAGVCWRADWPHEKRISAKGDDRKNHSGTGRKGGAHQFAKETLPPVPGKVGRRWKLKKPRGRCRSAGMNEPRSPSQHLAMAGLKRFDLLYLATPYTKYEGGITLAYIGACKLAARLLRLGVRVYCPIAHGHPIAVHGGIDPHDLPIWLPFDGAMMDKADALLVATMKGWDHSIGVKHEIAAFGEAKKPVYFLSPEDLTIMPCPLEDVG